MCVVISKKIKCFLIKNIYFQKNKKEKFSIKNSMSINEKKLNAGDSPEKAEKNISTEKKEDELNNDLNKENVNYKETETDASEEHSNDTALTSPSFDLDEKPLTPDATVLIYGPASAGKTCLLRRIVSNKYSHVYTPTQIDQKTAQFFKNSGYDKDVTLTFFDMAGQEDYQYFYNSFVNLCSVIFLCFPINDRDNLETVENNHLSILNFINEGNKPLVYLVGTKNDLKDSYSQSEIAEYNSLLKKIQSKTGYLYFETSSLSGTGYKELMKDLISKRDSWADLENKEKMNKKAKKKKTGYCGYWGL